MSNIVRWRIRFGVGWAKTRRKLEAVDLSPSSPIELPPLALVDGLRLIPGEL
jgi:hypothetical protein